MFHIDNQPDKGDYFKYCGQSFWEIISGNKNLFIEIIEPGATIPEISKHHTTFPSPNIPSLNQ